MSQLLAIELFPLALAIVIDADKREARLPEGAYVEMAWMTARIMAGAKEVSNRKGRAAD